LNAFNKTSIFPTVPGAAEAAGDFSPAGLCSSDFEAWSAMGVEVGRGETAEVSPVASERRTAGERKSRSRREESFGSRQ
jgi:hypothetical protein